MPAELALRILRFMIRSYPGGLFATGPGIVTYQFVGEEAGFDNQTWRINTPNELLFQNSTATSGDTKGGYSVLAGALPFLFRSNSVVGDDAINGGPIGPNLQIGIAIVSDTVAYAFFDDGGGSPIDADFDDVILRITAVFRGGKRHRPRFREHCHFWRAVLARSDILAGAANAKLPRPESRNKMHTHQIFKERRKALFS